MSNRPKELFWVDMRLSGAASSWRASAGVRGGKRSSLKAALDARSQILKHDPDAVVKIYRTTCHWEGVVA